MPLEAASWGHPAVGQEWAINNIASLDSCSMPKLCSSTKWKTSKETTRTGSKNGINVFGIVHGTWDHHIPWPPRFAQRPLWWIEAFALGADPADQPPVPPLGRLHSPCPRPSRDCLLRFPPWRWKGWTHQPRGLAASRKLRTGWPATSQDLGVWLGESFNGEDWDQIVSIPVRFC